LDALPDAAAQHGTAVTVTVGSNRLTSVERLGADLREVLGRGLTLGSIPPLWDGQAAGRIVKVLLDRGR
jgi:hypothetical protein